MALWVLLQYLYFYSPQFPKHPFQYLGKIILLKPTECFREHAAALLEEPYRYQKFSASKKGQTHVPCVVQVSVM